MASEAPIIGHIPGVVEVNTWGGYLKQYEIAINPGVLTQFNISMSEVFTALEKNNSVSGGSYIEKENQSYFIRGDGLVKSTADIENIVVKTVNSVPIKIKDLAKVQIGHANRFGAITANGEGEKVMGQIMMLKDANSNKVIEAVKERVESIQSTLPEGVYINPILERSELIKKTSFTVFENLILGCFNRVVYRDLNLGELALGLSDCLHYSAGFAFYHFYDVHFRHRCQLNEFRCFRLWNHHRWRCDHC